MSMPWEFLTMLTASLQFAKRLAVHARRARRPRKRPAFSTRFDALEVRTLLSGGVPYWCGNWSLSSSALPTGATLGGTFFSLDQHTGYPLIFFQTYHTFDVPGDFTPTTENTNEATITGNITSGLFTGNVLGTFDFTAKGYTSFSGEYTLKGQNPVRFNATFQPAPQNPEPWPMSATIFSGAVATRNHPITTGGGGGGGGGGERGDHLAFLTEPPGELLDTEPLDISVAVENSSGKIDRNYSGSVTLYLVENSAATPGVELDQSYPGSGASPLDTIDKVLDVSDVVDGEAKFKGLVLEKVGPAQQLLAKAGKKASQAASDFFADVTSIKNIWTGKSKTSPNWDDPMNWNNHQKPQSGPGQYLIFPSNAASFVPVDNMPNLTVGKVEIAGNYLISGEQPLRLQGNLKVDQGNPVFNVKVLKVINATATVASRSSLAFEDLVGSAPSVVGGPMTVQGPGTVELNCQFTNQFIVAGENGDSGNLQFGPLLTGNGSVVVNGGTLRGSQTPNDYVGSITLRAGVIKLPPASSEEGAASPLGYASLLVNPAADDSTMSIESVGVPAQLTNFLTLKGGKLAIVSGAITFRSGVFVKSASEIDPAPDASVTLVGVSDHGEGNTLTLGGGGFTELDGKFQSDVTEANGEVSLGQGFSGNGSITLSTDASVLTSFQATTFSGSITAKQGMIKIGGNSPLGTGELDLRSPEALSVQVDGDATLKNSHVLLNYSKVSVSPSNPTTKDNAFTLEATGEVDVDGLSTIASVPGTNFVVLSGPIASSSLTKTGGLALECTAVLSGKLDAPLTVGNGGAVALDSGFSGTGNVTVNEGGTLNSSASLSGFSGSVTVNGGTIGFSNTSPDLGVGALELAGGLVILKSPSVQLKNQSVALRAGAVVVSGGNLTISTPVTMAQGSDIDVQAGRILAFSGSMDGNLDVGQMGGTGEVDLGGTLVGNSVIKVLSGTVKLLPAWKANPKNNPANVQATPPGMVE
jgi:hypothetical protein